MTVTPNLGLPYIDANQSQKHVTHNDAIRALDALCQLSVLAIQTAPPGSPANGDCYLVAASATGAWTGKDKSVAAWQDGAWYFYPPEAGWTAYNRAEYRDYVYNAVYADWRPFISATAHGAAAQFQWIEQLVTCSGATTNIPLGQTVVIFAVALRVVTTVTGCTSITVNDSQNGNGHWASGVAVASGSATAGAATPGPYYNGSTTLALAAVGGGASFTGGTVRVSVLATIVTPPTS